MQKKVYLKNIIYNIYIKDLIFMANNKFYSITYPFTSKGSEGYFLDLDNTQYKMIKSDLMHLIFTTKGSRVRLPDFGTNLLQYLFNPNNTLTLDNIKSELQNDIIKYFPNITLTNLMITPDETNTNKSNIIIDYIINEGTLIVKDSISTSLI
jgi:phage baseplate assembly protein W